MMVKEVGHGGWSRGLSRTMVKDDGRGKARDVVSGIQVFNGQWNHSG